MVETDVSAAHLGVEREQVALLVVAERPPEGAQAELFDELLGAVLLRGGRSENRSPGASTGPDGASRRRRSRSASFEELSGVVGAADHSATEEAGAGDLLITGEAALDLDGSARPSPSRSRSVLLYSLMSQAAQGQRTSAVDLARRSRHVWGRGGGPRAAGKSSCRGLAGPDPARRDHPGWKDCLSRNRSHPPSPRRQGPAWRRRRSRGGQQIFGVESFVHPPARLVGTA